MRELVFLYNIHPGVFLAHCWTLAPLRCCWWLLPFSSILSAAIYIHTHRELKCHGGISFFPCVHTIVMLFFWYTFIILFFFLWEAPDVVRLHHQPSGRSIPLKFDTCLNKRMCFTLNKMNVKNFLFSFLYKQLLLKVILNWKIIELENFWFEIFKKI
jgi:hypothetical protein